MGFKIKYNSTEVDRSKGSGIPPNPGVYLMTIKGVKYRKDKNDIELTCRIKSGDHKGYGFWRYISLEPGTEWKLDQALLAVGVDTINKPKGTFDTDQFLDKDFMGRVKSGSYQGEPRPELAAMLPLPDDLDEDDDDEDDDDEDADDDDDDSEDEDDEDEEESDDEDEEDEDEDDEEEEDEDDEDEDDDEPEPPKKSTTKKAAAPAKKAPAKAAGAAKPKRPPKYETMELDELKALCTERGINAKGNKTAIIARLRANDDDPFSE